MFGAVIEVLTTKGFDPNLLLSAAPYTLVPTWAALEGEVGARESRIG